MGEKLQSENSGFKGVTWRQEPELARWWVLNQDGRAFWFLEPTYDEFRGIWFPEMELAPTFGYVGNHQDSLTSSPV